MTTSKKDAKKVKPEVEKRFSDDKEIPVEEAMAYVSRPHTTWDSASRELARLESARQRLDDDTRSNLSSVSAYSVKSSASVLTATGSVRRGHPMAPKSPPPPPPDLSVGGSSMGGFSFVAPRAASSVSTVSAQSQRIGASQPVAVVVGAAGGKSGVRSSSFRGNSSETARAGPIKSIDVHPSSAPGTRSKVDAKLSNNGVATVVDTVASFQVSGFVPRMAPKKAK